MQVIMGKRFLKVTKGEPCDMIGRVTAQGSDSPPSTSCVEEVLQPLSDELIQQCLGVGPWEHNGKPFWHRLLDWAVDAGRSL